MTVYVKTVSNGPAEIISGVITVSQVFKDKLKFPTHEIVPFCAITIDIQANIANTATQHFLDIELTIVSLFIE